MPRKRKSTLGPFPKTQSWQELVIGAHGARIAAASADLAIARLRAQYESFGREESAIRSATFLVALAVCSRSDDPSTALWRQFGIVLRGRPNSANLEKALMTFVPWHSVARTACLRAVDAWLGSVNSEASLFDEDPWARWRDADSTALCDLGRRFFTEVNRILIGGALRDMGPAEPSTADLDVFADEMSLITRTFSARWFNACAREVVPDRGSVAWYLRHCLGKLDLELSRELSDWDESARWRMSLRQLRFDLAS